MPKKQTKNSELAIADFENSGNVMSLWHYFDRNEPRVDIVDEGKKYKIRMNVPGVKKNDVKLNVTSNSLSVKAENRHEKEERGKGYYYRERSASGYYRVIPLPGEVNTKSAVAKLEDGVLEVTLDKKGREKGIKIK